MPFETKPCHLILSNLCPRVSLEHSCSTTGHHPHTCDDRKWPMHLMVILTQLLKWKKVLNGQIIWCNLRLKPTEKLPFLCSKSQGFPFEEKTPEVLASWPQSSFEEKIPEVSATILLVSNVFNRRVGAAQVCKEKGRL